MDKTRDVRRVATNRFSPAAKRQIIHPSGNQMVIINCRFWGFYVTKQQNSSMVVVFICDSSKSCVRSFDIEIVSLRKVLSSFGFFFVFLSPSHLIYILSLVLIWIEGSGGGNGNAVVSEKANKKKLRRLSVVGGVASNNEDSDMVLVGSDGEDERRPTGISKRIKFPKKVNDL